MAARINTRVVVPLIVILLIVVGGAIGLAYYTVRRTPEYYLAKGNAAAAANDWRTAREFYSKGVNRDQGNIQLLDLWKESLEHLVPVDAIEATEFFQTVSGILRKKTQTRPFEPQFHIDLLEHEIRFALPNITPEVGATLAEDAEKMFAGRPSSDDNPLWQHAYRFRGIANTYRMQDTGTEARLRDLALADLQRWLADNPDDSLAVDALVKWHLLEARRVAKQAKPREALDVVDEALQIATDFINAHPDDVLIRLSRSDALRTRITIERDLPELKTDTVAQWQSTIRDAEQIALQRTDVTWWVVLALATELIRTANTSDAFGRAIGLIDHALESDPDQPRLRFARATYLMLARRKDDATQAFQALIDSPNLPVGRTSIQLIRVRPLSVIALFDLELEEWLVADSAKVEERSRRRAAVEARMAQYRSMVSTSDVHLLYLEGRFALADGRPDVAANRLNQFVTGVGSDYINDRQLLLARLELADALQQTNQPGAAYEHFEEANKLAGGGNPVFLDRMVRLGLATHNYDRARADLARLEAVDPDSETTRQLRDQLALLTQGTSGTPTVEDETLQKLLEASELTRANQFEEARILLEQLHREQPQNMQVLLQLTMFEQNRGNTDKALAYVATALEAQPRSEQWRIIQAQIRGVDLPPLLSQLVDERSGLTAFQRHAAKWKLYAEFGFPDEARASFEAAKRLNADDPEIIEQDFAIALSSNDMKAAEEIARRAQNLNSDLANGLTYRGRYEVRNGDTAAGIATLLQATNLKPYDGSIWRYLGIAYRTAGNYTAAMDAFSKSLDREPTHVGTLMELATLQRTRNEFDLALESIRKARQIAPSNPAVRDQYLELEGLHGDRSCAIELREQMKRAGVGDLRNVLALAQLYQADGRVEDAKSILDELAPEAPEEQLMVAQAKAMWHFRQGAADTARDTLRAFCNQSPAPSNQLMLEAMLSLGQLHIDSDEVDRAIEVLESARQYQHPIRREVDRNLAALHLRRNDVDAALQTYEQAFISGEQTPDLGLQLVDLHLALARNEAATDPASAAQRRRRAAGLLAAVEEANGPSVDLLLLKGELAFQNNDTAAAERAFNDAVARYTQEPRVYVARARFNLALVVRANDIGRASRVRADVAQAMQLNPRNDEPLLLLAELARTRRDPQTGEPSPDVTEMISIWRRVLEVNPRNDDVRGRLIETLYSRGEYTNARVLLQEAIRLEPDRGAWYEIFGDVERQTGADVQTYTNYYLQAFEKQPSANRLGKLARALLEMNPPPAAQVVQLYEQYGNEVSELPVHRMLLARAQAATNNRTSAIETMGVAATQILAQPTSAARDELIKEWYATLPSIVSPDQFAARSDAAFGSLDDPWPQANLGFQFYLASRRPQAPDAQRYAQLGIDLMEAARARILSMPKSEARRTRLQQELGWNLSNAYYELGNPAKAVENWRWFLEVSPDHFATLNNLAFVLAKDLNDPQAALEPARKAYEQSPTDPTMLDTYGYVLFRNDRLDEAERYLRESLSRAELSGARMHLGQVLAAKGKTEDARLELNRARALSQQQGNAQRVSEIDELLKNL